MKTLIFGAGNYLLSDEGFGVHFVRYFEERYQLPEGVETFDGGTLGIMVSHTFEEADKVFLIDVVDAPGEPGEIRRYSREDIALNRIPVKLSPHQIGIQEMMFISSLRGKDDADVVFYGVIPKTFDPGISLSEPLAGVLPRLAELVAAEIGAAGVPLTENVAA